MNEKRDYVIECFTPDDIPYESSYGEWTVRWWQWALSIPTPVNPVLDETGSNANINQQGNVWFLAGTIGDENKIAHRICEIPAGKAILFPVINYIYADSPASNDIETINRVRNDIDDIVVNEVVINGYSFKGARIKSDPLLFELKVIDDNILNLKKEFTRASSDGYWVFVKPLRKGYYEIYFHGACSGGLRNATAQYHITVN